MRPRGLRNVENIDMSTTLWGQPVAVPFGIAPSAMHRLIHADGEVGTSKAAAARTVPMILSCLSNDTLEDVVGQRGDSTTPYGIQISPLNKRELMKNLLMRSKGMHSAHITSCSEPLLTTCCTAAGFNAVVVTSDAPIYGRRLQDERNGWTIIPPGAVFPNLVAQHVVPSEVHVSTYHLPPYNN